MTDDTRPRTAVSATEGVWTVRGTQVTAEPTASGLRACARMARPAARREAALAGSDS
ncbi:hypothetical protein ACIPSA_36485 [Streptomyces sp. NPDC086549]|uniref:hypothetical protein n=1 Tax=Streptomyces sp. NPDC086549 TaxID=3365752 RepID=UPI0038061E42